MSLCTSCGTSIPGDLALCAHHHCVYGDEWSASNRAFCNWLHRNIELPRLPPDQRGDDLYTGVGEVAG